MDTHVYIDGFNLYYGSLRDSSLKWLNLEVFCDLLLPKNKVRGIYYFTAKVAARPHDPDQPVRQGMYLRALPTLPRVRVELGSFLASVVRLPMAEADPADPRKHVIDAAGKPVLKRDASGKVVVVPVLKTEEKGSDVNLASFLLRDAFRKACQCAVVVSNDSDLLTPLRIAKSEFGMKIGLAPPRKRGSIELRTLADFVIEPRLHHFQRAQFPAVLQDAKGRFHKPNVW